MRDVGPEILEGHYARKQIGCANPLIAWSHGRRFLTGLRLADRLAGQHVVDYGCGDGTFLRLLMQRPTRPASAVGAEIDDDLVARCRALPVHEAVRFVHVDELDSAADGQFDAVICMEVLEHVLEPNVLLDRFDALLRPGGTLVVSVPVETGMPLLVKELVRRIAGWRGIGDYPGTTPYTPREYVRSLFAGADQHMTRPVHADERGNRFHDHKGFNWMTLRSSIGMRFVLEHTHASPVSMLTPHFGTQAWFVARKRGPA